VAILFHLVRFAEGKRTPTIEEQNELFKLYDELGIVNGTPSSWSDDFIRGRIDEIMQSNVDNDAKYAALEALDVGTQNNHAHGLAADVRDEITQAIDKVLGY
jgi:hypothetical protein